MLTHVPTLLYSVPLYQLPFDVVPPKFLKSNLD